MGLGELFEVSLGKKINVEATDRSLEMSSSSDMWPYMEKSDVTESVLVCSRPKGLMAPSAVVWWSLSSPPSGVINDLSTAVLSRRTVGVDVSDCALFGR